MRKRSLLPGLFFLLIALTLPAIIFAQQTRSSRRQPAPERPAAGNTSSANRAAVTNSLVRGDLGEALSVIQSNHIDGKKLDYNSIFKSSINGMLNVLDPHSTYFDPI